ncbi:hypothetical protein MNEG_14311 [Monoraphidium neglectum]|uniref:Uncharacterized protein n=1 Tax=Monoraphidium neglectum TaxID=145388 RepID=A0A0D2J0V8_9CHLO|nr:hypothetical protein MNEG_14311 [Monoraphidium neglectum]KIY93652.1 hypothetical protein MNEG_14311 [Monoraphidium neglectum]|eukprot:XP_013892672.1 hypothetical protein MNEG_14311 [Monoraphidium neglectum]
MCSRCSARADDGARCTSPEPDADAARTADAQAASSVAGAECAATSGGSAAAAAAAPLARASWSTPPAGGASSLTGQITELTSDLGDSQGAFFGPAPPAASPLTELTEGVRSSGVT